MRANPQHFAATPITAMRGKVIIGMSGGVDSAVAAAMLREQGYDCLGITLRLVPEPPGKPVFEPCCGLEAAQDAQRVCESLGIPHQVVYAVERFDEAIIQPFVQEYARARTPNPCVWCNRRIKFAMLVEYAEMMGADYVASGHFARVEKREGRVVVRRATHRDKDQSYMLAALSPEQLARCLFPLGEMTKEEVRAHARALGLCVAARPESQEICFIPGNDYGAFIEARAGISAPGPIRSVEGKLLGEHHGLIHYTVGQRRGLGIAAPRPLYVVRLDRENNALIVGFEEETFCERFTTGEIHWTGAAPQTDPLECHVQIRARHAAAPCILTANASGAEVRLLEPQRSVTPGQWAVFYDPDGYVLAAGMIDTFSPRA